MANLNEAIVRKDLMESLQEIPEETKKFMDDIQAVFKKRFPNSRCAVKFSNQLGGSIGIWFYLAKDESEVTNRIMLNDACRHIFICHDIDENGNLADKLSFDRIAGSGITRQIHKDDPDETYLAYSSIRVPYRKVTGTKEAVLKNFERYVDKLAQIALDNADDINNGIVNNLFDVRDKIASN